MSEDLYADVLARLDNLGRGGGGASGSPAPLSGPAVYLGPYSGQQSRFVGKELPGPDIKARPDDVRSVNDAYLEIDRWYTEDQRKLKKWARLLERKGILEPGGYTYQDLRDEWMEAVDNAARIYGQFGKKFTPFMAVDMKATSLGLPSSGGPSRSKSTSTNVNYSTREDARAILSQELASELGRAPSKKEVNAFYRALTRAQGANPSTTVQKSGTKTTKNGTTVGTQSTTTTGGVDAGAYAANYVDDTFDREQDARASATDYYDALLSLAGGS